MRAEIVEMPQARAEFVETPQTRAEIVDAQLRVFMRS